MDGEEKRRQKKEQAKRRNEFRMKDDSGKRSKLVFEQEKIAIPGLKELSMESISQLLPGSINTLGKSNEVVSEEDSEAIQIKRRSQKCVAEISNRIIQLFNKKKNEQEYAYEQKLKRTRDMQNMQDPQNLKDSANEFDILQLDCINESIQKMKLLMQCPQLSASLMDHAGIKEPLDLHQKKYVLEPPSAECKDCKCNCDEILFNILMENEFGWMFEDQMDADAVDLIDKSDSPKDPNKNEASNSQSPPGSTNMLGESNVIVSEEAYEQKLKRTRDMQNMQDPQNLKDSANESDVLQLDCINKFMQKIKLLMQCPQLSASLTEHAEGMESCNCVDILCELFILCELYMKADFNWMSIYRMYEENFDLTDTSDSPRVQPPKKNENPALFAIQHDHTYCAKAFEETN